MRTFVIVFFLNFFIVQNLFSQNNFREREIELKILGDSILKGTSDSVRSLSNEVFQSKFETFLNDSGSFNYPFDSLKNVSVLTSTDNKIRIYTWMLPAISRDKYSYFGFVQSYNLKLKKTSIFKLEEEKQPSEDAEKKSLSNKNWYGALYYKMLENKAAKGKIYTLLGWRGNNRQTTMKIIDVLMIDNKGVPKFGIPVFNTDHGLKHRVIFEYTSQAVMSLRYNEKKKMIVFDHLSPSNPDLKGKYEYYGPDMSYDALKFKNGKWTFMKNIEIGNPGEYDVKSQNSGIKHKEFYTPPK